MDTSPPRKRICWGDSKKIRPGVRYNAAIAWLAGAVAARHGERKPNAKRHRRLGPRRLFLYPADAARTPPACVQRPPARRPNESQGREKAAPEDVKKCVILSYSVRFVRITYCGYGCYGNSESRLYRDKLSESEANSTETTQNEARSRAPARSTSRPDFRAAIVESGSAIG